MKKTLGFTSGSRSATVSEYAIQQLFKECLYELSKVGITEEMLTGSSRDMRVGYARSYVSSKLKEYGIPRRHIANCLRRSYEAVRAIDRKHLYLTLTPGYQAFIYEIENDGDVYVYSALELDLCRNEIIASVARKLRGDDINIDEVIRDKFNKLKNKEYGKITKDREA